MTTPVCGRCQWMQNNPNSGQCETPQCTSCGKCYRYLQGSECPSCKKSSGLSALAPPPNPTSSALTPQALAPNIGIPSIASSLPAELFQGVLSQPTSIDPSTSSSSNNYSRLNVPYGSQVLKSQLQGSIRASPSGRRTVGKLKGRKKKHVERDVEEDSPEIKIPMTFPYLSGIGKSTVVHPLTPRKFKINLNNSDWFWTLGWDVYAYYLQEAVDSAWPSKQLQKDKKIHPLPPNFSPTYCIIADNGILVSKESMESTIQKSKKLDSKKFGLIFNMQKYLATLPKEPFPKPENLKPTSQKRKQNFEITDNEDDPTDNSELESSSRTHKRKRMYDSSSEEDDKIDSNFNNSLHQPICSKNSKGTQPKSCDCLAKNSDQLEESLHGDSTSMVPFPSNEPQTPLSPGQDQKADDDNHQDNYAPKATVSVSVQTNQTLTVHDILIGRLDNDESMSLKAFGNTHELAPSAKVILPYPACSILNWNEGWLLSMITKNGKAAFKPVAISFRVN
ncbi:uncharacterized protein MELLADRAFT_84943 [Melampsora larici-populina 98AG31]|uniref:Uncharacterized protein n=1 Tax=Melampsora larici-populina (strain 98AG31 / pathotype 3-4-7) TaxID=747676 RepID=F4RHH1_MELLP|nr:uncharacterized protein MELLADRAFT_84943 [Melampsora larici-populina 98AG31]EGG08170.1 hypothetical protein MELLADRAFT_84943 [Melampsora larici-populina 98AG31]